MEVKKVFPFVIAYKGELYVKTSKESQVGDIALCLEDTPWTTEGKYYLVIECCPPISFKGIIGDDGHPMGVHDRLGRFRFYRKKKLIHSTTIK